MNVFVQGFLGLTAAIGVAFTAFHFMDQRHEPSGIAKAVRAESQAQAATLLLTVKNLQRGRLASYDAIPTDQLTEREKKDKLIIEYDLQNIETIEQAAGLAVPE